jgi:hypothetical protein
MSRHAINSVIACEVLAVPFSRAFAPSLPRNENVIANPELGALFRPCFRHALRRLRRSSEVTLRAIMRAA